MDDSVKRQDPRCAFRVLNTGPVARTPDAMEERGLLAPRSWPGRSYSGSLRHLRRWRPLVEACDGPQVVGMDLHRCRLVLVRMAGDGRGWPDAGHRADRQQARRPVTAAGLASHRHTHLAP